MFRRGIYNADIKTPGELTQRGATGSRLISAHFLKSPNIKTEVVSNLVCSDLIFEINAMLC